jgi:Zn-finger protein
MKTDVHLHEDRCTFTWRPMYIYMKTDVHLHEDRRTFTWRPMYIYMKTDVHLHEERCTFTWRPMYIYMKTDVHLHEDRCTFTWRPMYLYMKTDVHLHEDRCTFTWRPMYIYMKTDVHLRHIAEFLLQWQCFRQKLCRKSKHIFVSITFLENHVVCETMCKFGVQPESPQMTTQKETYDLHVVYLRLQRHRKHETVTLFPWPKWL